MKADWSKIDPEPDETSAGRWDLLIGGGLMIGSVLLGYGMILGIRFLIGWFLK